MKSILDPSFKYVPAVETDIRKTFERVREEQAKQGPVNATGMAGSIPARSTKQQEQQQ